MKPVSETVLTRFHVQGFRSLLDVNLALEPEVTVLVGPNGSGKSSLLNALAFLQDCLATTPEAAIHRLGGVRQIESHIREVAAPEVALTVELRSRTAGSFTAQYALVFGRVENELRIRREVCRVTTGGEEFAFQVEDGKWIETVAGITPLLAANRLALPLLSGIAQFEPVYRALTGLRLYHIEPGQMQKMQSLSMESTYLLPDASNAAIALRQMQMTDPEMYARMFGFLQAVHPDLVEINVHKDAEGEGAQFAELWLIENTTSEYTRPASIAEGTLRILAVMLAVYNLNAPTLVMLEEPETAVHPGALAAVAEAIREAGLSNQILVTTHSPDLITHFEVDSLRAIKRENGISQVGPIRRNQMEAIQENLFTAGELHRFEGLSPS